MSLRPFQAELVDRVRAEYASGARSVVMTVPTGAGKTFMAAEIIRRAVEKGRRALFLAHLSELITDSHDRLQAAGVRCGFVQAGRPTNPEAPVQVASTQTLHARSERPPADLVILDEAHRGPGPTVRAILDSYPHARLLGLTASPQRGDGQPLGDQFERLVCGPSVRWLISQGFLVPCDVIAPPRVIDGGLAVDAVVAYERWARGSRAIVFATNVPHAKRITEQLIARGFPAGLFIESTTRDERVWQREALARGDLRAIVSVNALIEGFDAPSVETVILARAFTVTGSFLQAIGRGLRPSPTTGKTRCVVLDLRGAANMHGLPDEERRWSLTGEAVVRTETLKALAHCKQCLAIFRPAKQCPRCGAPATAMAKVPRVLNRAEKLESLSSLPQNERDRRYVESLERLALYKMRIPPWRVKAWVLKQFVKRFGRLPEAA